LSLASILIVAGHFTCLLREVELAHDTSLVASVADPVDGIRLVTLRP
jgi:hypothetical protein